MRLCLPSPDDNHLLTRVHFNGEVPPSPQTFQQSESNHVPENPHNEPVEEISAESITQPEPGATAEPTVGTGTAMALGCVAGTVVLILFGIIFIFFATMR